MDCHSSPVAFRGPFLGSSNHSHSLHYCTVSVTGFVGGRPTANPIHISTVPLLAPLNSITLGNGGPCRSELYRDWCQSREKWRFCDFHCTDHCRGCGHCSHLLQGLNHHHSQGVGEALPAALHVALCVLLSIGGRETK